MPRPPTEYPHSEKSAERRLLLRLDFRVLPILWLLYLVSFVDRSNIGNAKIQGMDEELQLTGQRYNIALFVFNIGYLVAGVPLSVAFKKTGPKSLAVMMFCWGNNNNAESRACQLAILSIWLMQFITQASPSLAAA